MDNKTTIPDGYRLDGAGNLIAEANIRPEEALEDQLVAKLISYANDLNAQIERFKAHCLLDISAFLSLLREKYGARSRGGKKGNMTFHSFDRLNKVTVRTQERLTFGPGLQIAKELIDECVADWTTDANPHLRTLIDRAFRVDQEGKLSVAAILDLGRIEIDDDRWRRAVQAISDSLRPIGSKLYILFYSRPSLDQGFVSIPISLAAARDPDAQADGGAA